MINKELIETIISILEDTLEVTNKVEFQEDCPIEHSSHYCVGYSRVAISQSLGYLKSLKG